MLAILEVGAIALLIAFLLLSKNGESMQFSLFAEHSQQFPPGKQLLIGVLLLIGFGAKLGLLPFYEWLPNAYSAGSGATGAIASGVILNAAFFGLMRGLFAWLPALTWGLGLGVIVILISVLTAMLTILYAFQQTDWRRLLSYSSAENAAISVLMLGVAILFRQEQQFNLAALAGVVSLIHLAGHSLAKGTLFIAADGVFCSNHSYVIKQNGLLKQLGWLFGVGALFAAMSLSAMPPQAGFVSEWYVFQTIFHGFNLNNLVGRLTLIGAGIGMALTAAIALATFVKAFGVGLLGANSEPIDSVPLRIKISVFTLGVSVLLLAVGMLVWINALSVIAMNWFNFDSPAVMHTGFLLVPLSASFAFISPTLLVIVTPLLALIPIGFIIRNLRYSVKRAPIWYGGLKQDRKLVATTALTFSNAMHYFYRFVYLPKHEIKREYRGKVYFVKSVSFSQQTTAMFSTYLFKPIIAFISFLAEKIRLFQSGNLNFYNSIIGALFILILLSVLF
jgi:hydrogenase-4 component B